MAELDKSWLPESELLPDGSARLRLPSETEWLLAGGKVKKEEQKHIGYCIRDDWIEIMQNWLTKWQNKYNMPGKAPRVFNQAYEFLTHKCDLILDVDFTSMDDLDHDIRYQFPGIANKQLEDIKKFVVPLLEEKEWTLRVVELKHPDEL